MTPTPTVQVWRDVVEALAHAAVVRDRQPHAALLVGRRPRSTAAPVIRGYRDLAPYATPLTFLAAMQEDWRRIVYRIARPSNGLALLGWVWIASEGRSVLTPEVQVVQRSLFHRPWQVTCLVDRTAATMAFYGFDRERCLANVPFDLISAGANEPANMEPES